MYRRRREVIWRRGADRVVAMTAAGDEALVLRGAGAAIWGALATAMSPGDLASDLRAHYQDAPDALIDEVRPFLEELLRHQLIELVEP